MQKVNVRVPASTSNLGPGFDCLGVALRLYNFVTIMRADEQTALPIVDEAARLFFKESRRRPFSFSFAIRGDVPVCRGLGGSVTVRLGVLHGLNDLSGRPFDRSVIFRLCAQLEGHPDNAAPASFGGFTVARGGKVQRFDVLPRLYFVLLIPDFETKTARARRLLPRKIAHVAAVENSTNACAITAAFASQNYEAMRGALADHLHQPFRQRLLPFLPRVIAAAEKAGAVGGFLSGSGSTIAAATLASPKKIAAAMLRASGLSNAQTVIAKADNHGVKILPFRIPNSALRNSFHGPTN
jgi:homoserine kinase